MADHDPQFTPKERWTLVIQLGVSGVFLGASLFVILRNTYPDATTKWAFGIAGLVIGYWLR
jgi:hypothetical protein